MSVRDLWWSALCNVEPSSQEEIQVHMRNNVQKNKSAVRTKNMGAKKRYYSKGCCVFTVGCRLREIRWIHI
jgi:hypothetical protein